MSTPDKTSPGQPSARQVVRLRARDAEIIEAYGAGLSLREMAEKLGLGNPQKAAKELQAALRRLDQRLIDGAAIMRADEMIRLQRMTAALEPRMADPKAAAELRLQSESRRRLYGLDLQREIEEQAPEVHVHFALPEDRVRGDIEDATFEEVVPQLEAEASAETTPED